MKTVFLLLEVVREVFKWHCSQLVRADMIHVLNNSYPVGRTHDKLIAFLAKEWDTTPHKECSKYGTKLHPIPQFLELYGRVGSRFSCHYTYLFSDHLEK